MSYILDALKKSEAERQRQAGPTLLQVRVTPPRSRLPFWASLVAVLLVLNVGVLAFVLMRRYSAPTAPAAAAPAAQSASVAAPVAQQPAPLTAPPVAAPPATVPAAAAPVVAATPAAAPPQSAAPPAVIPPPSFPVAGGNAAAVPAEQLGNPADYEPALPRSATPQSPQAGVASGDDPDATLPTVQDLLAGGMTVPDMQLNLHFYDQNARARFVWINGRMYHEGENTSDGARIERIVPRGVAMSWHGRRFMLSRGE